MNACLASLTCVAIDVGPTGCVIHSNIDDLTTASYTSGVTQFVLNRLCLSKTPLPVTTTAATENFTQSSGINITETSLNFIGL